MASHDLLTAMATISTIIFISTSTLVAAEQNSTAKTFKTTSFHDVLKSNGLPMGLFPKGISDFAIDPASGRFQLRLPSPVPCDTKFETRVRYESTITGTVDYGKIGNLKGVAAQELFLWLPVKSIRVDIPSSGLIYFDVGGIFKQFSLSCFETPKDCNGMKDGEGIDLVSLDHFRLRSAEDEFGNLVRNRVPDEEQRAVS